MKSKKGFTLVELLAVIVILGIIVAISITSYTYVKSTLVNEEYDNLISLIETKASAYASEYYVSTVSVQELINSGYLSSDDGYIYSPVDNEIINCYIVKISVNNGNYEATFYEKIGYDDEGNCNYYDSNEDFGISVENDSYEKIEGIEVGDSGVIWYGDDICLTAIVPEEYSDYESSMIFTWSNNLGLNDVVDNYMCIDVDQENYLASYYLEIKFKKDENENYSLYNVSKVIRIDSVEPAISVTIENETEFTQFKIMDILVTDAGGSGVDIVKLYICESEDSCEVEELSGTDMNYTIVKNATYYVVATDNIGNDSKSAEIVINTIDYTAPSIELLTDIEEDVYYQSLPLDFKIYDSESGIMSYSLISAELNCSSASYDKYAIEDVNAKLNIVFDITKNGEYKLCVKDNANNIGEYKFSINTVDTESPNMELISSNTGWATSTILSIDATDNGVAGVYGYYISEGDIDCSSDFTNYNSSDLTVTTNGTYTGCVIDNAGNISKETILVDKIDTTMPSFGAFSIDTTNSIIESGYSYYQKLVKNITVSDSESGIKSIQYCYKINGSSSCDDNGYSSYTVSGASSQILSLTFNSNASKQQLCVVITDNAGNSTTTCDGYSYVDGVTPTINSGYYVSTDSSTYVKAVSVSYSSTNGATIYYSTSSTSGFSSAYSFSASCGNSYSIYAYAISTTSGLKSSTTTIGSKTMNSCCTSPSVGSSCSSSGSTSTCNGVTRKCSCSTTYSGFYWSASSSASYSGGSWYTSTSCNTYTRNTTVNVGGDTAGTGTVSYYGSISGTTLTQYKIGYVIDMYSYTCKASTSTKTCKWS